LTLVHTLFSTSDHKTLFLDTAYNEISQLKVPSYCHQRKDITKTN